MPTSPEYYQKNKERIVEYNRNRYKENKEKLLEYQKEYRQKNRDTITLKSRNKRRARLEEAVELLGGKCSKCNLVFDPVCYDFHHVNPSEKDLTIGENMLISKTKLFNEIKKCVLLCANCHRLTHKEIKDVN